MGIYSARLLHIIPKERILVRQVVRRLVGREVEQGKAEQTEGALQVPDIHAREVPVHPPAVKRFHALTLQRRDPEQAHSNRKGQVPGA